MFDVATVTALMTTFFTNVSVLLGAILATLLTILAALLGLGFAIRHVKRWITGKKA